MNLDIRWENFKLSGLIYEVHPRRFEFFWAWLLKKRVKAPKARDVQSTLSGNSALVAGLSPGVVILPASKEERHRERELKSPRGGECKRVERPAERKEWDSHVRRGTSERMSGVRAL